MCEVEGNPAPWIVSRTSGNVPIMVKSEKCHLRRMAPAELVRHHEEAQEMGGYFIINGNERIIRQLIMPRRNHVRRGLKLRLLNRILENLTKPPPTPRSWVSSDHPSPSAEPSTPSMA